MFFTLTSRAPDARDLGFVLAKHPDRVQRFSTPGGPATVFFPAADSEVCTVALVVQVDSIGLTRSRVLRSDAHDLGHYINDRPYAASSLLAVALGRVFRSALAGRCKERPDLVATPLALEIHLPTAPARGGADLPARLFEPLGWSVQATPVPLDPAVPEWGPSDYVDLRLSGELTVQMALLHLYVLLPVLDDTKHYWVSEPEVDKLVHAGEGWLGTHPERNLIAARYLAHRRSYVADATERLTADEPTTPATDEATEGNDVVVEATTCVPLGEVSTPPSDGAAVPGTDTLAAQRRRAIVEELTARGAVSVVDLGCGEGRLIHDLLTRPAFTEVIGADVAPRVLSRAEKALHLDRRSDQVRARLTLIQTSVTYRDRRLADKDAIVLSEVIEHLDPERLGALERSVFHDAAPKCVIVTTPNADYNPLFPSLPAGTKRHPDHRFEWTRAEFRYWADRVAGDNGYTLRIEPIGPLDPERGAPTQMAVFTRDTDSDKVGVS